MKLDEARERQTQRASLVKVDIEVEEVGRFGVGRSAHRMSDVHSGPVSVTQRTAKACSASGRPGDS
jgi:hypothetical protein